ncbi:MAG: hypothetical protein IJZ77_02755 [Bacilli bacterium]|nr:hypothetical protein [Bacilli bacterium]
MSATLFMILMTVLSAVNVALTEAVKRAFANANKKYSANALALISAIVSGCGGTAIVYLLLGIAFTTTNIICLFLMGAVVWVGSMIGYDKAKQLVEQLLVLKK